MNNKINTRRKIMMGVSCIFLVIEALIFMYTYLYNIVALTVNNEISLFVYFYIIIFYVLVNNRKIYNVGNIRLLDAFFGHIVINVGSGLLVAIGIFIAVKSHDELMLSTFFVTILIQIVFGSACSYILHQVYMAFVPKRRLLAVVGDYKTDTVLENKRYKNAYYIVSDVMYYYDGIDKIIEKSKDYDGILVGELEVQFRNDLVRTCFNKNIQVFYMLKIADVMVENARKYVIYDQIYFMNGNHGLSIGQKFVKRLMDIIVSGLLLLLLSPICLIIMICIKLEDGGPIFYKQQRLTINGKVFNILKFRSMKENADNQEPAPTMQEDNRITKVGKIIRNHHFDEIPQLINVLKGDMSMVGPRPERKLFTNIYSKEVKEFECRLKVKAGITGYAQVYGKYNTNVYDKLKLDLFYILNYSLLMDIKLLILTIRILFQRETVTGLEYDEYLEALKKVMDEKSEESDNQEKS